MIRPIMITVTVVQAVLLAGCTQDARVDALQERIEAQRQDIADLREQLRLLSTLSQEQNALRQSVEELNRKLVALEMAQGSSARAAAGVGVDSKQKQYGVDINQPGETRARIIEVPQ